mmetsp:Transcript_93135/g.267963  ORF Transcript_93135/g.267963 Transcript_93135/m.267963 type:complete len:205 (+) Transcript_93135:1308-1922(+)
MATKLMCEASSSFERFLFCARFAAICARFKRFSRRDVFFAPTISRATSFASASSSLSLSSRMPSRPFVLLPRNKCANAAAILQSGWTRPELIRFTTCLSLQTFLLYNEMNAAHARRATSTSPSFILAKNRSRSSLLVFWLFVFTLVWLISLMMWAKICLRKDLSDKLKSLKYKGSVRMQGNWSRFLKRISACTSVSRMLACITS